MVDAEIQSLKDAYIRGVTNLCSVVFETPDIIGDDFNRFEAGLKKMRVIYDKLYKIIQKGN